MNIWLGLLLFICVGFINDLCYPLPLLVSLMCNIFMFSVRIAYDKGSGRSRGFGFVDFAEKDDALSAKHAMDGKVK